MTRRSSRLIINDFAGHAFTSDLASELAQRGWKVEYSYCSTNTAPHANFSSSHASVRPLPTGKEFQKYRLLQRVIAEIRYGWSSSRRALENARGTVVVANMPVISAAMVGVCCRLTRQQFIVWLQDVQSGLAESAAGGSMTVRGVRVIERLVLRLANRVVAISDNIASAAVRLGAPTDSVVVLPNWPVLAELPMRPRQNDWASTHIPDERSLRFLYSGTLARKHEPRLLVELAASRPDTWVIVVSEGEGTRELLHERVRRGIDNMLIFPYQPFETLPDVLGSADVLIVLLNPAASANSVPSKVLSYLCAGRPILGSLPRTNPAAIGITNDAQAGLVAEPGDDDAFLAAADRLMLDRGLRCRCGRSGRAYAERSFDSAHVVEAFLRAARLDVDAI